MAAWSFCLPCSWNSRQWQILLLSMACVHDKTLNQQCMLAQPRPPDDKSHGQFSVSGTLALVPVWVSHCVLLNISSGYTQKRHMHLMVNMVLAILSVLNILQANQSKCTYTISEYDNLKFLLAENISVYKSAFAGRKQILISAWCNSSSGTSPSYAVITIDLSMGLAFCPPWTAIVAYIWRVMNQNGVMYQKIVHAQSVQWMLCLMYTRVIETWAKVLHVEASQVSQVSQLLVNGYLCMQQIVQ